MKNLLHNLWDHYFFDHWSQPYLPQRESILDICIWRNWDADLGNCSWTKNRCPTYEVLEVSDPPVLKNNFSYTRLIVIFAAFMSQWNYCKKNSRTYLENKVSRYWANDQKMKENAWKSIFNLICASLREKLCLPIFFSKLNRKCA